MKNKLFFTLLVLAVFTNSCAIKKHGAGPAKSAVKARVIIDAGHGGTDAGAIGTNGLKEKDLTLDIALRVKKLMALVMPQVEVVLTRDRDRFVGLEERISIAHKAAGDVFLSIHINSSANKDASGFEVYSLDVASDNYARRLALRENFKPGIKYDPSYILEDLRAKNSRKESDRLAFFVSKGLSLQLSKKVAKKNVNDRGYNQANFQVLFVKNMPAVLTEILFISNPEEEKLLSNNNIRDLCAKGLVLGIKKYLTEKKV